MLFALILLTAAGKLGLLWRTLQTRKTMLGLLASGICVSTNWGAYIWAIAHGQALDASLAYYMLPLVMLGLGMILLHEKLNRRQQAAIAIVVLAVALLTYDRGRLPWVVLVLPLSFGFYSLIRKQLVVDALIGVTIEALILMPAAAIYLLTRPEGGALATGDAKTQFMLVAAGPLTTIPLVLFSFGARRMKMATLGLMQYMNPTLQMLCAVLLMGEMLSRMQIVTFAMIWLGLAIYSLPLTKPAS